jgi:hypothetical protein
MTELQEKTARKKMFERLASLRDNSKDKWGVYFLGVQIYPTSGKLYSTEGIARGKVVDMFESSITGIRAKIPYPANKAWGMQWGTPGRAKADEEYSKALKAYRSDQKRVSKEKRDKVRELLKEFEDSKILEFRLTHSIEPLFPHSVVSDKNVAERVKQMLNAKDSEMFDLAMLIVKQLQQNEVTT